MSILSDLRLFIRRHQLIPDGARVVVGASGGPDSLALLHALNRLAPERNWHLHAAYLHHGLRPEADAEARFVAEVASAWELGCTIERTDVAAIAAQPGVSVEEAARQVRYVFLGQVALRLGAPCIAVGHHADDQAETVLMHLLRGSGLAGLRGMLPGLPLAGLRLLALPLDQRPDFGDVQLVRPWLETSRAEILAYCEANGLQPRFDASNADTTLFRNRLRHEVIPMLREINPRLTETLGRTAQVLQGDYEVLSEHRRALWRELAGPEPGRVRFDLVGFRALPCGDQRALLRKAIVTLRPDLRNINWSHTEQLLDVLALHPEQASGGPYPLVAGLEAILNYQWLDIVAESIPMLDQPTIESLPMLDQPTIESLRLLLLPGEFSLGPAWKLQAKPITWPETGPPPWTGVDDPACIWLPGDIPQPLIVRPQQPGDRLRIFGLGGSKAIPDLMTELKLPRPARPFWPLLVGADGEILWLVGKRAGEGCRLPDDATSAWEIRLTRVEKQGGKVDR